MRIAQEEATVRQPHRGWRRDWPRDNEVEQDGPRREPMMTDLFDPARYAAVRRPLLEAATLPP
jgi:hypothetical protein